MAARTLNRAASTANEAVLVASFDADVVTRAIASVSRSRSAPSTPRRTPPWTDATDDDGMRNRGTRSDGSVGRATWNERAVRAVRAVRTVRTRRAPPSRSGRSVVT